MTLVDVTGYILTTIRDDPTVAALTTRVRGGEPAPGDALGPGGYQRFIVLTRLGAQRQKYLPVQEVRILAACYGLTHQDAAALAGAVSDAIHNTGVRLSAGGVGIWNSWDDSDAGGTTDPDTGQPRSDLVISVAAATELIP